MAKFYLDNNKLELRINIPENNLSVFTLKDPYRIVLDLKGVIGSNRNDFNNYKSFKEIYPGISYRKFHLPGPVMVNVLDIDLNDPMIDLKPLTAMPDNVLSKSNLNQFVQRYKGIAGINASFFKPPTGLPLGALIVDGEYYTGPIFNRVALVIDRYNRAYLDVIRLHAYCIIPGNIRLNIQNINQPRLSTEGYMLYNSKWTSPVPKTLKNELQIAVVQNKVIQKTTGALRVPENGYVITGPNKDAFKAIKVYDSIDIQVHTVSKVPNIKHAIGAGPYLLKEGNVYIDCASQKFAFSPYTKDPRSAAGITADNHLLLVTVDGRQKNSIGMSFHQLAHFMKSLGVVNAMNLDGGSSTQMSINGKIVNNPTIRGGTPVSTAIIVKEAASFSIANKYP
jgi:exopolysaccharide biosynthesis protein